MARSATPSRHDSHATTAQGAWSTKRITTLALFCAASLILSFIEVPIFPPAPYLKYDPSGIVALVGAFAFGPGMGALIAIITWVVKTLFVFNPWGHLMAVVATVTLVVPAGAVYRRTPTMRGAIVGMAIGCAVSVVACVLANLVVTPLYTSVDVAAVLAMIVPILLPFNLIKVIVTSVVTALIYKPVSKAIGD